MSERRTSVVLKAVGDVCLAGTEGDPFERVVEDLKADLLFCNLECALTERGQEAKKNVTFRASPESVRYIEKYGFNLISLANNHVLDFGHDGLEDTIAALESRNLRFLGAGRDAHTASDIVRLEQGGLRIIALASADVSGSDARGPAVSAKSMRALGELVEEHRDEADLLIVSYHGGIELETVPSPFVVRSLRALVDAGADLVLAHHPHVLQAVEQRGRGLIAYSLGNFVFDNQRYGRLEGLAAKSMILEVRILYDRSNPRSSVELDYSVIPVHVGVDMRPRRMTGREEAEFRHHMKELTNRLRAIRESDVDIRRMDDLAREFHRKSAMTIVRYGLGHLGDFSLKELAVGSGFVIKHFFRRMFGGSRGRR